MLTEETYSFLYRTIDACPDEQTLKDAQKALGHLQQAHTRQRGFATIRTKIAANMSAEQNESHEDISLFIDEGIPLEEVLSDLGDESSAHWYRIKLILDEIAGQPNGLSKTFNRLISTIISRTMQRISALTEEQRREVRQLEVERQADRRRETQQREARRQEEKLRVARQQRAIRKEEEERQRSIYEKEQEEEERPRSLYEKPQEQKPQPQPQQQVDPSSPQRVRPTTEQQIQISKRLNRFKDDLRSGKINVNALCRCIDEVFLDPDAFLVSQSLHLLGLWSQMMGKGRRMRYDRGFRPVNGTFLQKDKVLELAHLLLRLRANPLQLSTAMWSLGRLKIREDIVLDLARELEQCKHRTDSSGLANGAWALANLEKGEEIAQTLIKELLKIKNEASAAQLCSGLWTSCLFSWDKALVIDFLDELKTKELSPMQVQQCFHAAALYSHDLDYWRNLFMISEHAVQTSTRKKEKRGNGRRRSNGEEMTQRLVGNYLKQHRLGGKVFSNHCLWGFECDILLLFPNGETVNIEFDGRQYHNDKNLRNTCRDRVLNQLGVSVIRFSCTEIDQIERLADRRRNNAIQDKLRLVMRAGTKPINDNGNGQVQKAGETQEAGLGKGRRRRRRRGGRGRDRDRNRGGEERREN